MDSSGRDQDTGVRDLGRKSSVTECWKECRRHADAKGCEFGGDNCFVHTQEIVTGNNNQQWRCLVFKRGNIE